VLTFDNGKSLPLNKTNLRLLAKWFGNHTRDWVGRKVSVYRDDSISFGGNLVGGWRLRKPTKPAVAPPVDTVDEDDADPVPF
jgi:hypothetical protein